MYWIYFSRFGAEVVEPQSSSSRSRQPIVFGGTGYRLGETSDDSQGKGRAIIIIFM